MNPKKKQPHTSDEHTALEHLQETISQLEKKVQDTEMIAKRAQSEYFHLKMDMDAYRQRTEQAQKDSVHQGLIEWAKRLLPFVSQLKTMVSSIPAELVDNNRAQGVTLLYTKVLKNLEQLSIVPIPTIGNEPDFSLHIPMATEPVEDATQKGKIIKELEEGYVYKKDELQQVVIPAKVSVGA